MLVWNKIKAFTIPLLFITLVILILLIPESKPKNAQKGPNILNINKTVLFPTGIKYVNSSADSTIDGDTIFSAGTYQYKNFDLRRGKLTLNSADYGKKLVIAASQKITIDKNAEIFLTGSGNPGAFAATKAKGLLPGINYQLAGGGGGNIAAGGDGDCRVENNTPPISSITNDIIENAGSGGGASEKNKNDNGGNGGGLLYLIAPEVDIQGKIVADGASGVGGGGGGSGGTIVIYSDNISISGAISLMGGQGGTAFIQGGGGGSGGVLVISKPLNPQEYSLINLAGGMFGKSLDLYSGCDGAKGANGDIILLH